MCSHCMDFYLDLQVVHTETIFKLVWQNRFTETAFKEPRAFTLFIYRFRLHAITYWPVEFRDNGPVFGGVGEDDTITPC